MAMDAITRTTGTYQEAANPTQKADNKLNAAQETKTTQNVVAGTTQEISPVNSEENDKVEKQRLVNAIDDANKRLVQAGTAWEFTYQLQTKRVAIQLIDRETKEVIREIPSEEHQLMLDKLRNMTGMLVDEKR